MRRIASLKNTHIMVCDSAKGTFHRVGNARYNRLDMAREHEKVLEAAGSADAMVVAR